MVFMRKCKKCLLPETYPNISFDKKGICSYCSGTQHFGVEKDEKIQSLIKIKDNLKKDFESFVEKYKGKQEYDCLLLYSGGKDSTYLLYILKEKYGLNVLALTVDNGFIKRLAKENIKRVVKKLNVEHIFLTPGNEFFKKLYQYYLMHPGKDTYCDKICSSCSEVIHGIGLIEAAKRKIPFVALANSPDQTDHYFYEIPTERIAQSWVPEELTSYYNDDIDLRYFWDPKKYDYYPRFFLPFHVIDYPGEKAIIETISSLGILKKRNLNPFKTNCYLVWLLQYLDLNKNNYDPYIKNLSRNIQNGYIKCNLVKRWYYISAIKLLKSNVVKRRDKTLALDYLNIKKKDIFKKGF